jgi:hypothetical protein
MHKRVMCDTMQECLVNDIAAVHPIRGVAGGLHIAGS